MQAYKQSRWAREILALQNESGAWGYFHTLSEPKRYPLTTEQALRRLRILGFTINDAPIAKAVSYMQRCMAGKAALPDRREKTHDWDLFTRMMLATWIRTFTPADPRANAVAAEWAGVITVAFSGGAYSSAAYAAAYKTAFGIKPNGGRFVDFISFYQVSLLAGALDPETEGTVLGYILAHPEGIYYICGGPLSALPGVFASRQSSRYLGAIELLAAYRHSAESLGFVADWLWEHQSENGTWDFGNGANDHVYFPLSDSWRQKADRERDCTERVQRLLGMLGATP